MTHPLESLTAFLDATVRMRELQKVHDKARQKGDVGNARKLLSQREAAEKQVDALLVQLNTPAPMAFTYLSERTR